MRVTIDITGDKETLDDLDREVQQLVSFVKTTFTSEVKKRTPIDTGRARRGWSNRQTGKNAVIENKVPYIERLEKGWSKQAPRGFVKQAISATQKAVNRRVK